MFGSVVAGLILQFVGFLARYALPFNPPLPVSNVQDKSVYDFIVGEFVIHQYLLHCHVYISIT